VILIAPAEAINSTAANALLKLLEEPPPRTLFLIVADAIDEVMPTIRSRCVLLRIEAPAKDSAVAWLAQQGVAAPEAVLASAGGAPLAALEVATGGAMNPELRAHLIELLVRGPKLVAGDIAKAVPRDMPVGAAIDLMQRWCWDLLALRSSGGVRYHPQQKQAVTKLAAQACDSGLWQWQRALQRFRAASEHPLNPRLVVEAALLDYLGVWDLRE
jgi:DNA polymerase-3 subunit delta'